MLRVLGAAALAAGLHLPPLRHSRGSLEDFSRSAAMSVLSKARRLLFYRLLQQSVGADPITFRQLVANPRPKPAEKKPDAAP